MTEIIVDPCDQSGPISGSTNNTGGNGDGTNGATGSEDPIAVDRVSFPERIIISPVPQSERLVTIMNSTHFYENSFIRSNPSIDIEDGNYPIKRLTNDASTIFEIPGEKLEEAGFRANESVNVVSREVFGSTGNYTRGSQAWDKAKSKGLVEGEYLDYVNASGSKPTNTDRPEEIVNFFYALQRSLKTYMDRLRYATGLVFTNDPENNNSLIISNKDQFHGEAGSMANSYNKSETNIQHYGCPFYLSTPTETETIQIPNSELEHTYQYFGINKFKSEKRRLKFVTLALEKYAQQTLNNFLPQNPIGNDKHTRVKNFADIYLFGFTGYSREGLSSKTNLSRSQLRNIVGSYPLQAAQISTDITFDAPQAFFREETDYVALGKQMIVDIKANVTSEEINDGSAIELFPASTQDELQKKNFYRIYGGRGLTRQQVVAEEQGRIVKFSSRNIDRFSDINENQKNLFSKRVNIVIENQKAPLSGVSSILKRFDMEKYIIEMMSDTNGLRTIDEIQPSTSERSFAFLDQHYASTATSTEIESYYSQYLQPGEDIQEVKERINSVLDNFNQKSFKKNILQTVWTTFTDSLSMLKFTLPPGHPLRKSSSLMPGDEDNPGLYGTENGVINALEWPLGFHESMPVSLDPQSDQPTDDAWRFDELKYAICSAKLKEYLEPKGFRSYQDILEGKKCYSEVIGYRIKKFVIDQSSNAVAEEPVQEFYLMGTGTNNVIDFVDSQVIFEKKYKYEISSINFVVANLSSYFIDDDPRLAQGFSIEDGWIYECYTTTMPMWAIVEAPLFSRIIHVVDKPPLSPQVSFLPYMGHDDKIKLLLQSNFGRLKQKPIKILEEDTEKISKMRQAQDIDIASGKLEYANDSLPTQFQMIRIDRPPKKYSDFGESNKIFTIDASGRSAAFDDQIQPNKDYYYIFRAIDKRGISNPSFVYKVRMVSYENGIYMDLKEYDMSKKEDQVTIPFRKFLQIEPSNLNKTVNFGDLDVTGTDFMNSAPNNVSLGNSPENTVWNKKFKIKIKSKSSGRQIDLIVKFKQKINYSGGAPIASFINRDALTRINRIISPIDLQGYDLD